MWNRIKNTEGKYKNDIDSIIDEQIKFYSKLFTTEGWDENSANKLTQHIEGKLIKVITKLPNSEQSYKGKVKTHNYINRQNQSTTGKL